MGCFYRELPPLDAATCAFEQKLDSQLCDGQRVPRKVFRTFDRARRQARRAARREKAAAVARLLARANRLLARSVAHLERARERRNPPITVDCAEALRSVVLDVQSHVAAVGR